MPAKNVTPTEFIKKEAVLIDEYMVKSIFINVHGNPYISIVFELKDVNGKILGEKMVMIEGQEFADYVTNQQTLYNSIKNKAYALGKQKGIIPDDAGVI